MALFFSFGFFLFKTKNLKFTKEVAPQVPVSSFWTGAARPWVLSPKLGPYRVTRTPDQS